MRSPARAAAALSPWTFLEKVLEAYSLKNLLPSDAFDALSDSRLGDAADLIFGFQQGFDKIDLSAIDASSLLRKNQAFSDPMSGLDAAFTGAGQLRFGYVADADMTVVQGNTDGDAAAEFEIHLVGQVPLVAADFVL